MLELLVTGDDSGILRPDDICNALHELVELFQACIGRQSQWSSFCIWPTAIGGSICSWSGTDTDALFAC